MSCPLAANIFDELTSNLDEESGGAIVKDTVENVIEQMTTVVFEEKVTGVKQRSRDRLERLRLNSDFTNLEPREEALTATIDIAKEVDDQGYVYLEDFWSEYVVPWLEVMEIWLSIEFPQCACTAGASEALERLN